MFCFFSLKTRPDKNFLTPQYQHFNFKTKKKNSYVALFLFPKHHESFSNTTLPSPALIPKSSISPSILDILPSPFEVSVKLCNVAAALFISWGLNTMQWTVVDHVASLGCEYKPFVRIVRLCVCVCEREKGCVVVKEKPKQGLSPLIVTNKLVFDFGPVLFCCVFSTTKMFDEF